MDGEPQSALVPRANASTEHGKAATSHRAATNPVKIALIQRMCHRRILSVSCSINQRPPRAAPTAPPYLFERLAGVLRRTAMRWIRPYIVAFLVITGLPACIHGLPDWACAPLASAGTGNPAEDASSPNSQQTAVTFEADAHCRSKSSLRAKTLHRMPWMAQFEIRPTAPPLVLKQGLPVVPSFLPSWPFLWRTALCPRAPSAIA